MKAPSPNTLRWKWLLTLLAGVVGLAINQFGLSVFGDRILIFGGWTHQLIAIVFGPWHGFLAAAINMSATPTQWGHPWALLAALGEGLFIGYWSKRLGGPFRTALVYWLVIGIPLTAVGILEFTDLPFPDNWATVVKYPANSLLMAMIAISVYNSRRFRRAVGAPEDQESSTPLRDILSQRFGLIVILSTASLAIVVGHSRNIVFRQDAEAALLADAAEVSRDLSQKLDSHLRVLHMIAAQAKHDPATVHALLDSTRQQFPAFLTMLSANQVGQITAASPRLNAEGTDIVAQRINIIDREYFQQPMTTGKSYISPVFRGRGFGDDLIVAMSVPVVNDDKQRVALIEGSLNLSTFLNDVAGPAQIRGRGVLVTDRIGQVVASAGVLRQPLLLDLANSPLSRLARQNPSGVFDYTFTEENETNAGLVAFAGVPAAGWRVYLAEPTWRFQETLAAFYVVTLLAAAVAIGTAVLLARGTATDVTRPLASLVTSIRALSRREPGPLLPAEPHLSSELTELSRAAHDAALTLHRANREMAGALDERNRSHQQLRQILLHLDDKVQRRTEDLAVALQQAESANRAKSEFIAATSHELRTPLNVILGMSEVLAEGTVGPLNERQRESVRYIDESGRHLLSVINDILDLSKIEAGKLVLDLQDCSVADLCESSLRLVRPAAAAKQQSLTLDNRAPDVSLVLDARRMKQVLVNLLSNAIKFTPSGGRITLEVTCQASAGEITFAVVDNGIGVPPEYRSKLFQTFQQVDGALNRRHSGTGLGLALVRRITELHGGRADFESTPGAGSRFFIVLPLGRAASAPVLLPEVSSSGESAPVLAGKRVLIADDHEANILLYRSYPSLARAEIIIARNGREAVELATSTLPDLVLMDVQMPVMDGLEATRTLRNDPRTAHLPIIIITALASEEDRARCLEANATAYLSKPVSHRDLAFQINEALRHRPSVRP